MKKQPILNIRDTVKLYTAEEQLSLNNFTSSFDKADLLILDNEHSKKEGAPIRTDYYALILCLAGSCQKIVDHHTFEVLPNTIHLVAPGQLNSYNHTSSDLKLKMLFFKRSFLDDLQISHEIVEQLLLVNPDYPPVFDLDQPTTSSMLQLLLDIEREQQTALAFHLQIIRCRIIELLFRMNRACERCVMNSPKVFHRNFQLLHQFRKLVDQHFKEHNKVETYARLLNITPKHLSDVVKQESGDTALTIIHQRILREAQFLLVYSDASIKEITGFLNFDSSSHFGRFFKNKTGINPNEFRKKGKIG
jgi:AraC family transcriptional activator of pobA